MVALDFPNSRVWLPKSWLPPKFSSEIGIFPNKINHPATPYYFQETIEMCIVYSSNLVSVGLWLWFPNYDCQPIIHTTMLIIVQLSKPSQFTYGSGWNRCGSAMVSAGEFFGSASGKTYADPDPTRGAPRGSCLLLGKPWPTSGINVLFVIKGRTSYQILSTSDSSWHNMWGFP